MSSEIGVVGMFGIVASLGALIALATGGLDALPHNGAVIALGTAFGAF